MVLYIKQSDMNIPLSIVDLALFPDVLFADAPHLDGLVIRH